MEISLPVVPILPIFGSEAKKEEFQKHLHGTKEPIQLQGSTVI